MKKHLIAAVAAGLLLTGLLGACGSDDDSEETSTEDTAEQSSDDSTAEDAGSDDSAGAALVTTSQSDFGEILVDDSGLTLYGFTEDTDGVPTCDDACADAWPPLTVDSADLPEGLDAAVFSVAERSDGTFQLVAGDFPLYRFASDTPGDTNGQGSGGVWFVVAPDGSLIEGEAGAATESNETETETTEASDPYDY